MMSLWDALRMNMMISYQELVRTFLKRWSIYFVSIGPVAFPRDARACRCCYPARGIICMV
ncbi:hypothetical protein C4Z33_016960 [Klebsiella pneumoniae subsp. pneumoniae]|nr:hypothetical protein C4Z33_016960 [Klebsiella pneumoniae subsp. pneumoniae]